MSDHSADGTFVRAFIVAACAPLDAPHASGTLDEAEAMLRAQPWLGTASIHTAAILGDDETVRRFLALDPSGAKETAPPHGWDALTHLCFSRYLRLDRPRSAGFVRAAEALLRAGASATTGWMEENHRPSAEWESALYGAAGIARDADVARLLLTHGADPNEEEVVYHAPEGYDNAALAVILETGRLSAESLATMLVRKCDWHDLEGVTLLLGHGADPNFTRSRWHVPINHAVQRDNSLAIVELLLDHGGNPTLRSGGRTAAELAAGRGRADLLDAFERRGFSTGLSGIAGLAGACARDDAGHISTLVAQEPALLGKLVAHGGELLANFAGAGNVAGLERLLALGVPVTARWSEGDAYFDVASNSSALHVAAWRAQHEAVRLLIDRGAPIDALDGRGRTPLMLAVRACVDSYWMARRSPASVEALLRAGATKRGVACPTGYAAIDYALCD